MDTVDTELMECEDSDRARFAWWPVPAGEPKSSWSLLRPRSSSRFVNNSSARPFLQGISQTFGVKKKKKKKESQKTRTSVRDHWEHLKRASASSSGSASVVCAMGESNMAVPGRKHCTRNYSVVEQSQ